MLYNISLYRYSFTTLQQSPSVREASAFSLSIVYPVYHQRAAHSMPTLSFGHLTPNTFTTTDHVSIKHLDGFCSVFLSLFHSRHPFRLHVSIFSRFHASFVDFTALCFDFAVYPCLYEYISLWLLHKLLQFTFSQQIIIYPNGCLFP